MKKAPSEMTVTNAGANAPQAAGAQLNASQKLAQTAKASARAITPEEELALLLEETALVEEGLADQIILAQADTGTMTDAAAGTAEAGSAGAAEGAAGAAAGSGAGATAVAGGIAGLSGATIAAIGLGAVGVAAAAGGGGGGGGGGGAAAGGGAVALQAGIVVDGPIANATVFRDLNGNGIRDANEPQTTSNAQGVFQLSGEGGVFVAYGGTDTITGAALPDGLTLKGLAVDGGVLSPLTTLAVTLAQATAVDSAAPTQAELEAAAQTIITNLGLTGIAAADFLTYNPVEEDDSDYIAQAQVILTVINGLVAASGGQLDVNDIVAEIADMANNGAVDFTDPTTVQNLITAVDTGNTIDNDASVATLIANLADSVEDAVTTNGYTSSEAINAYNESNGDTTQDLIAVAAGNTPDEFDLTGQTLTYTAASFLTLAQAAIDAGATVALSDTGTNLAAASADLSTLLGTLTIADVAITVTGTPTIAQLSTIDSLTTADLAYSTIKDTAANLVTNAGGFIDADIAVIVDGPATIAQLDMIDGHTENITVALIADSIANLLDDLDEEGGPEWIKPGVNIVVTDAASLAELAQLDTANGAGSVTASTLSGTIADLLASPYVGADTDVTVTDAASIAQLTTLNTTIGAGTLTVTAVTDTAANLVANAGGFIAGAVAVTVTDAATIAQLTSIDALTTGILSYTAINGTATDLEANVGDYVTGTVNVTITDAATIAQLTAIDGHTFGTLTYAAITDAVAALFVGPAVIDWVIDGVAITVTDLATLEQLEALDTANGSASVTAGELSGTIADLLASPYVGADTDVTVTDAASIAQLTTLNTTIGAGTLTVTAVTDTAANLVANAGGFIAGAVAVTVTDAATIAQLTSIDALTTGILSYTAINGTATDLEANVGDYVTGTVNVTITDAATIAQLTAIDGHTFGTLTYAAITDAVAALFVGPAVIDWVIDGVTITVTDLATLEQLEALDAANGSASVTAGELSGTIADLLASPYVGADTDVTVTDAASIAQLTTLKTTIGAGTLTVTAVTDTAANLVTNAGGFVAGSVAVTVTDAATIAQLTSIDALTTGTLSYTSITGTAADLETNAGNYVTGAVNVTVADSASIDQLTTIDGLTTGTLTYGAIHDAASNIAVAPAALLNGATDITAAGTATAAQAQAIIDAENSGSTSLDIIDDAAASIAALDLSGNTGLSISLVVVQGLAADTDLSNLVAVGVTIDDVVANVSTSIDITANPNLDAVTQYVVDTGQTLTLNASQADGIMITGDGNVTVTGTIGAADLSGITVAGTITLSITVGDGEILTITAEQANGATIAATGTGNIIITGADPTVAYDFSNITADDDADGSVIIELTSGGALNPATTFGFETQVDLIIPAGETLLLTKSDLDKLSTVSGAGNVDFAGAMQAGLDNDLFKLAEVEGEVLVTGHMSETLTLSQADLDSLAGLTVTGTGNIIITGASGDLTGLLEKLDVDSGKINFTGASDANLMLAATDLPGDIGTITATGTGNIVVTGDSAALSTLVSDLSQLHVDAGTIILEVSSGTIVQYLSDISSPSGYVFSTSGSGSVRLEVDVDDLYTGSGDPPPRVYFVEDAIAAGVTHVEVQPVIDPVHGGWMLFLELEEIQSMYNEGITLSFNGNPGPDGGVMLEINATDLDAAAMTAILAVLNDTGEVSILGESLNDFLGLDTALFNGLDSSSPIFEFEFELASPLTIDIPSSQATQLLNKLSALNNALAAQQLDVDFEGINFRGDAPELEDFLAELESMSNVELGDITLDVNEPLSGTIDFSSLWFDDDVLFGGDTTVDIPSGVTLILGAGQANDLTAITGSGTLVVFPQENDFTNSTIFFEPETGALSGFTGTLMLSGTPDLIKEYLTGGDAPNTLAEIDALLHEDATLIVHAHDPENISLTASEAAEFIAAGVAFSDSNHVVVNGTAAELAALLTPDAATLRAAGASVDFDASDDMVALTLPQAIALRASGIYFADDDFVTLASTPAAEANGLSGDVSEYGALTITGADPAVAYDFDGITATDVTVQFTSSGTLNPSSTFPANVRFDIASGVTLTLSGAQLAQVSVINGDGAVEITNATTDTLSSLNGTLGVTGGVSVTGATDENLAISANDLGMLDSLEATGSGNISVSGAAGNLSGIITKLQVDGGSISIQGTSGALLTIAKSDLDTVATIAATGAGIISFNGATNADLATDIAKLSVQTGSLNVYGVSDESFTLTEAALSPISYLQTSGTGGVTLTGVTSSGLAANLTKVEITGSGTFSITGASGENLSVSSLQMLTEKISSLTATGNGNLTLTEANGAIAADLAKLTVDTGNISVEGGNGNDLVITQTDLARVTSVTASGAGADILLDQASGEITSAMIDKLSAAGELRVNGATNADLIIDKAVLDEIDFLSSFGSGDVTLTGISSNVANALAKISVAGDLHVLGTTGNDTLDFSGINELISIEGGQGADELTGGDYINHFIFSAGDSASGAVNLTSDANALSSGVDVITNFDDTWDRIDLSGITELLNASVTKGTDLSSVSEGDIYIFEGDGNNGVGNGDAVVLLNTTGGTASSFADFEMAIYIVGGAGMTLNESDFILPQVP